MKKEKNMENITFADFQKMDIRVAEIKTAEEVEGADKIYKLVIDLGGETRTLVAGVKLYYPKEELPGKKVLVLANLEPKVIRGIESHGMVLCAHSEDRSQLAFTTVEKEIAPGSRVS
jgi:methionyl-tRNA synthetase